MKHISPAERVRERRARQLLPKRANIVDPPMQNDERPCMVRPDPETQSLFAETGAGTAVLVAEDITTLAGNGRLISDGFDPNSLQATSYDLRIGGRAIVAGSGNETDLSKERLVIQPGSYAGVISLEKIRLPN